MRQINIFMHFLTFRKKKRSFLKSDDSCEGGLEVVKDVIPQLVYKHKIKCYAYQYK